MPQIVAPGSPNTLTVTVPTPVPVRTRPRVAAPGRGVAPSAPRGGVGGQAAQPGAGAPPRPRFIDVGRRGPTVTVIPTVAGASSAAGAEGQPPTLPGATAQPAQLQRSGRPRRYADEWSRTRDYVSPLSPAPAIFSQMSYEDGNRFNSESAARKSAMSELEKSFGSPPPSDRHLAAMAGYVPIPGMKFRVLSKKFPGTMGDEIAKHGLSNPVVLQTWWDGGDLPGIHPDAKKESGSDWGLPGALNGTHYSKIIIGHRNRAPVAYLDHGVSAPWSPLGKLTPEILYHSLAAMRAAGIGRAETYPYSNSSRSYVSSWAPKGYIGAKVWPHYGLDGKIDVIPPAIRAEMPAGSDSIQDALRVPGFRKWWDDNHERVTLHVRPIRDAHFDLRSDRLWDRLEPLAKKVAARRERDRREQLSRRRRPAEAAEARHRGADQSVGSQARHGGAARVDRVGRGGVPHDRRGGAANGGSAGHREEVVQMMRRGVPRRYHGDTYPQMQRPPHEGMAHDPREPWIPWNGLSNDAPDHMVAGWLEEHGAPLEAAIHHGQARGAVLPPSEEATAAGPVASPGTVTPSFDPESVYHFGTHRIRVQPFDSEHVRLSASWNPTQHAPDLHGPFASTRMHPRDAHALIASEPLHVYRRLAVPLAAAYPGLRPEIRATYRAKLAAEGGREGATPDARLQRRGRVRRYAADVAKLLDDVARDPISTNAHWSLARELERNEHPLASFVARVAQDPSITDNGGGTPIRQHENNEYATGKDSSEQFDEYETHTEPLAVQFPFDMHVGRYGNKKPYVVIHARAADPAAYASHPFSYHWEMKPKEARALADAHPYGIGPALHKFLDENVSSEQANSWDEGPAKMRRGTAPPRPTLSAARGGRGWPGATAGGPHRLAASAPPGGMIAGGLYYTGGKRLPREAYAGTATPAPVRPAPSAPRGGVGGPAAKRRRVAAAVRKLFGGAARERQTPARLAKAGKVRRYSEDEEPKPPHFDQLPPPVKFVDLPAGKFAAWLNAGTRKIGPFPQSSAVPAGENASDVVWFRDPSHPHSWGGVRSIRPGESSYEIDLERGPGHVPNGLLSPAVEAYRKAYRFGGTPYMRAVLPPETKWDNLSHVGKAAIAGHADRWHFLPEGHSFPAASPPEGSPPAPPIGEAATSAFLDSLSDSIDQHMGNSYRGVLLGGHPRRVSKSRQKIAGDVVATMASKDRPNRRQWIAETLRASARLMKPEARSLLRTGNQQFAVGSLTHVLELEKLADAIESGTAKPNPGSAAKF